MKKSGNIPVHEFIKQHLRRKIEREELAPGDKLPSENELARKFEVSRTLARQALRELEIEGYIIRSQGSRSRVAPAASRSGGAFLQTKVLALSFIGVHSKYTSTIMETFIRHAYKEGYHVLTHNIWLENQEQFEFLRMLQQSGVSGLGLGLWQDCDSDLLRKILNEFIEMSYPVVQIDRYISNLEHGDVIASDNAAIGEQLTSSLIAHGRRRICFLADSLGPTSVRDRFDGYKKALSDNALSLDENLVVELENSKSPADNSIIRNILKLAEPPDAFLCVNEYLLTRLHDYLKSRGLDTGNDFGIAVVDDSQLTERLGIPAVISVQAAEEIGEKSVQCLLSRIQEPNLPPRKHFIKPVFFDRT